MKNPVKLLPLLCLLPSFLLSCEEPPSQEKREDGTCIYINLSCELLDSEKGGHTRSSHPISSLTKISDANYYLFRGGKLQKQEYFDKAENFCVSLPDKNAGYNLYILANVGKKEIEAATAESAMGTAVHVDYGSKENYFTTIGSKGFPMAASFKDFSFDSNSECKLKRLVHTLYVRMNTEGLNSTEMEFTGVEIKQAARDVFPFAEKSKAQYIMDGDAANLSNEDLKKLNEGESISLYLLENMRGELIPGNSSWKDKIPDNISSSEEAQRASYIEMKAKARTVTATYEENIYRAYLGSDPSDFNVRRSTYFNLVNNFTNDMIVDEGWRIESDTPEIIEKLAFVDTRYTEDNAPDPEAREDIESRPYRTVDAFYIMPGFTAVYYIYRSSPRVEFTVSIEKNNDESSDCESYMTYETRRIDDYFTALMINTSYPMETDGSYHTSNPDFNSGKSVRFKVRSADGLVEDTMICKVITKALGLEFRYEGVSANGPVNDNGVFNMYFCNPLGLSVQAEITGTVKGYVSFEPDGTWFADDSKSPSVKVRTGNKYAEESYGGYQGILHKVIPVSGKGSRIDRYDDKSGTYGKISEIRGFHEYFKTIWNTTGWNGTNWNGSEGYDKHACPTELSMNIKLQFSSPNNRRLCPHNFSGNAFQLPVHIINQELTKDTESGAYYGGGTDMGFIWHHYYNASSTSYTTYRFRKSTSSPDKAYYSGSNQLPIGVTINGSSKWKSDKAGIPCSEAISQSFFSDLGFDSFASN